MDQLVAHSPQYEAFYVPAEVDPDEAVVLGLRWLVQQPGVPLILFHAKSMVDNNRVLGAAIRQYRIRFEAPRTIWNSRWQGGSILAPWASDKVIRCLDDDLALRVDAVCIIGRRPDDPEHAAWISARSAVDLRTGRPLGVPVDEIISDPVVRIAIDDAEQFVNHNNALVQYEDKAYLVRTLQALVRGGHGLDLNEIAAYAMATGWTGDEVERIREYGQQILEGRGFRLRSPVGPEPGAVKRWEAEAAR
jgi:hypothetical protein